MQAVRLSADSGWSVIFIKPRRLREPGADLGEFLLFLLGGLVTGQGPAVGVQQVRLVEFPNLEAQGVLDGVALLLTEAVGPDVAAVYKVVGGVAEVGQHGVQLAGGGLAVASVAAADLGGRADVAKLADAPVAV